MSVHPLVARYADAEDGQSHATQTALAALDLEPIEGGERYRVIVPEQANIAADTAGVQARGARANEVAVRFDSGQPGSPYRDITFAELDAASSKLAVLLQGLGVAAKTVVAVHTGSRIETVITHLAIYKLGAIAATLSQLYGPETVAHVLNDSGATVMVTQDTVWRPLADAVRPACRALQHVLVIGQAASNEIAFDCVDEQDAGNFVPMVTHRDDPALLVYTSGSTGQPKGVLHAHRILHGYKPTLELFFNLELRDPELVLWTAADWAWVGGLIDIVYPALLFGHRLIATQHRFEAEWALDFMQQHGVTHILLTPTALNRLAQVQGPRERWPDLKLRVIFTGGEPLSSETLRWLHEELGVICNEGYGMSEVNHMIGNCQAIKPIRPGSMGWEFPGHVAALVDEQGVPVADGEVGEIVTVADTPTLFLGYWNQPELTAAMRLGNWVRTRDLAVRDAKGYYWYRGRNDDLIKSAGYRIGPVEIEDVLMRHPAVVEVAVIGVPDVERGQVVCACVALAGSTVGSEELTAELREYVRAALGPYKTPRIVKYFDDLPHTTTGKVSRAQLRKLA